MNKRDWVIGASFVAVLAALGEGKRVQRFVYKGMGTVPANQGVLWPR